MKDNFLLKAKRYHSAVSCYDVQTVESMVKENYVQHNIAVPDGRSAFIGFMENLKVHKTKIENIRIFQDESYVVMHHLWKNAIPFGGKMKIAFHIIKFDFEGLIAEHWSVMEDLILESPSHAFPLSGTREIDLTIANAPLKKKASDRIESKISSPEGSVTQYHKLRKILGSGDFVLTISEGLKNGKSAALYDLYRFSEDDVSEHWSIHQEIPPNHPENNNTMFGFS